MEQGNNTVKTKKRKDLSRDERVAIEVLLKEGYSLRAIAKKLDRCERTIQREKKRGLVKKQRYNPSYKKYEDDYIIYYEYKADVAQKRYEEKLENKGRPVKLGNDWQLALYIENAIKEKKWSPDVIVGRIKEEKLSFNTTICTKTLYNYIGMGLLYDISNFNLLEKLKRKQRKKKHSENHQKKKNKTGKSISERPINIEDRIEMGHWEIDLVVGKKGSKRVILTLVERVTRKFICEFSKDKTQKEVLIAIKNATSQIEGNFGKIFKTITSDNGSEFLNHEEIIKILGCDEMYYAHPFSSWERGSNENANRILRRFLPKGTDFTNISDEKLKTIENWINNYPRKILGYKTANELFVA